MATTDSKLIQANAGNSHGSLKTYVMGFLFSVMLTLIAYFFVSNHVGSDLPTYSKNVVIGVILALAAAQFTVQLIFFLHLGKESKPRWKLTVFLFMLGTIVIIVAGSLWMMSNLNYRMTPQQINNYMNSQDGL